MKKYYQSRIDELELELKQAREILNNLNNQEASVLGLGGSRLLSDKTHLDVSQIRVGPMKMQDGYNTGWPIFTKVKFVIKKIGSPSTVKDIVEYIVLNYEPFINKAKFSASVSGVLSAKVEKPENNISRVKNEYGDFEYELTGEDAPFLQ